MVGRVLLGKLGTSYGLWISKAGFDVQSASVDQYLIHPSKDNFQPVVSGTFFSVPFYQATNRTLYQDNVYRWTVTGRITADHNLNHELMLIYTSPSSGPTFSISSTLSQVIITLSEIRPETNGYGTYSTAPITLQNACSYIGIRMIG